MKITIEIDTNNEMEKLSALLKAFDISAVNVVPSDNISVIKGDKNIDPTALFGVWSENPRTIEDIRDKAWNRKGDN
jgi:hypothetical protein